MWYRHLWLLFLLGGTVAANPPAVSNCSASQFDCKNGRCIPETWECDNVPDCENAADELHCKYHRRCAAGQYMCPERCLQKEAKCNGRGECLNDWDERDCDSRDGHKNMTEEERGCPFSMFQCRKSLQCLPSTDVCNGFRDCRDGEDEENCEDRLSEVHCPNDHKRCRDRINCIPTNWICDGQPDCNDGSDEWECTARSSSPWVTDCAAEEFRCSGTPTRCISLRQTCDGKKDCLYGEDESNCDNCKDLNCEHGCRFVKRAENGLYHSQCYCPRGGVLRPDNRTCEIPDKCRTDKGLACQHYCLSPKGSRGAHLPALCKCAIGYSLSSDGVSCILDSPDGAILVAKTSEILRYPFYGRNFSTEHPAVSFNPTLGQIYSMDYSGYYKSTIITADGEKEQGIIAVMEGARTRVLKDNVGIATSIQFDNYGGNMFFIAKDPDPRAGVNVCSLDGIWCQTIIPLNNTGPSRDNLYERNIFLSLVLDHPGGRMYISEVHNGASRILRADKDGSNVTVFLDHKTPGILGLAIDPFRRELYFGMYVDEMIQRINVDTLERSIVFSAPIRGREMKFFNGFLLWTEGYAVMMLDTRSSNKTATFIETGMAPSGLTIESPVFPYPPAKNPCASSLCSWICVAVPHGPNRTLVPSCLCPEGYHHLHDEQSCVPYNYPRPVFRLSEEYLDELCSDHLAPNATRACLNGGYCIQGKHNLTSCNCPVPFIGLRCEIEDPFHVTTTRRSTSLSTTTTPTAPTPSTTSSTASPAPEEDGFFWYLLGAIVVVTAGVVVWKARTKILEFFSDMRLTMTSPNIVSNPEDAASVVFRNPAYLIPDTRAQSREFLIPPEEI